MGRFAGIKGKGIGIVSDQDFVFANCVLPIPAELDNIFSEELIANYRIREGLFVSKKGKKRAKDLRVALVGNFLQQCGISTYNEHLFPEITKLVGSTLLFAEKTDHPTGKQIFTPDKVLSCWERGQPLQELVSAIKAYDPDIVLVSHEYGIFPNARHFLSFISQLSNFRVIVIMHSVFPHHIDKQIFEGIIPEIVVHLQGAQDNLEKEKHLLAKVHTIPHGCYDLVDQSKLWDNYRSKRTFVQQGFGFKYKGFEDSIRATSLLKEKYHDVFFTALFSESPFNRAGHQAYFEELSLLIEELGVQESVAIVRGFQPDNIVSAYLRSNQVAVFPYKAIPGHEVFGASGAVRMAFSLGLPAITSSIPHFSDTPSIKAEGAEQLSKALDRLFSDEGAKVEQIKRQNQFVLENSWTNVAQQYVTLFEQGQ